VVIARYKRAGRIEQRDGKLYATHSMGTEQRGLSPARHPSSRARPDRPSSRTPRPRGGAKWRFRG
jgi:hypothetical protein